MLKKDKKPIGEVTETTTTIQSDEVYTNVLSLSPALQKELDDQDLVPRFVDYQQMKRLDGIHRSSWRVYKRKNSDIMEGDEVGLGTGPAGLVRRGSCVLAVKSKEAVAKHKKLLQQKADRQKASYNKQAAEELRHLAKQARLNTSIVEGYGEDDNE